MTAPSDPRGRPLHWVVDFFFSAPIYVKVAGIGLLVTLLFGMASLYQTRIGVARAHYTIRGEAAWAAATSLAQKIGPLLLAGNKTDLNQAIQEAQTMVPGVRYLFVLDHDGAVVSHGASFPKTAPADLAESVEGRCFRCHESGPPVPPVALLRTVTDSIPLAEGTARIFRQGEERVIDLIVPIEVEPGGLIRVGVGDLSMTREVAAISRSLLITLAGCAAIGLALSLALSYVLVRPIHALSGAANRIREGDFSARAEVWYRDEIGALAQAFNEMSEALGRYRTEVQEKEAARQKLLGRLVQAQEEERKHMARELHDQLGQSLSHTLLTLESACAACTGKRPYCCQVKEDIRGLIDEVRLLAWNARPSILDDYGLDQALNRLVNETAKRADFTLDYQYVAGPELGRLPNPIEVTLYRIAQEALTNIVRHAQASQASVVLLHQGNEVRLIVEDDGKGMSGQGTEKAERVSLGLLGMSERAALAGGTCLIDSAIGKGAIIRVKIPLEANDTHGDSNLHSG